MQILITGAGGFVGITLADHLRSRHSVDALSRADLDIADEPSVLETTARLEPQLIINCAVLGVEDCETDPEKAKAVNVDGAANLAKAAFAVGAEMVHFSTNYVFDGKRVSGSYTTDDEARPVNEYGQTKLEGELAVAAGCSRHFIVRTSWVFGGSKASFFDKAIRALRCGRPVEAIADNWASTTFVNDLVERIEEIVDRRRYGTYHVANSGICSKYEFSVEAAGLFGYDAAELVRPIRAGESGSAARRPRYTPMQCKLSGEIGLMPLRDWRSALRSYLV